MENQCNTNALVLFGPPSHSQSVIAQFLTSQFTNTQTINARFHKKFWHYPSCWQRCTEQTDLVIVENLRTGDLMQFYNEVTQGVRVNQQGQSAFNIYPAFLFVCPTDHQVPELDHSFARRFNYIDLHKPHILEDVLKKAIKILQRPHIAHIQDIGIIQLNYFLSLFYKDSPALNILHDLNLFTKAFTESWPGTERYVTPKYFRKKLKRFCERFNYRFNPHTNSKRHRGTYHEWFVIGDNNFKPAALDTTLSRRITCTP